MCEVMKICPTSESLNSVETNITCTEDGCTKIFNSKSNLQMHLVKHHKKGNLIPAQRNITYEFYCPVESCIYNINKMKHFTHKRYLKQHFLKVHAKKEFICPSCSIGFSTSAQLNSHIVICGIKFTCLDCDCFYASYEALLTHSKRKNHLILNKNRYIKNDNNGNKNKRKIVKNYNQKTGILILPKVTKKSYADAGVQTETIENTKKKNHSRKRTSTETQTCLYVLKKVKCTETQTNQDNILHKAMKAADLATPKPKDKKPMKKSRKNILPLKKVIFVKDNKEIRLLLKLKNINDIPETQTENIDKINIPESTNTVVIDNSKPTLNENIERENTITYSDVNLSGFWKNSQCQTTEENSQDFEYYDSNPSLLNHNSKSTLNVLNNCYAYSNTGVDGLISNRKPDDKNKFSSIETQTEIDNFLNDDNSCFDQLLYTNMHTQTCNDILSELGFNDIETQTAWPDFSDLFVSQQTQTSKTTETSHIETQTDLVKSTEELS